MPASRTPTFPSLREFQSLARTHTLVPVTRTVAADLETPVSAFLRVAANEPEAFLLESVEGGEHVGRYTFIGIRPYRKMTAHASSKDASGLGLITLTEGRRRRTFRADIFTELKQALEGETPARFPGLPPFTAGAVGFFSYDVVRSIEKLPTLAADELHVPDAHLMFFDEVLAFDHVRKAIHLIVTAGARQRLATSPHHHQPGAPGPDSRTRAATAASVSTTTAYATSLKRLDRLERLLNAAIPARKSSPGHQANKPLKLTARTKPKAFLKAVEATKEYIRAGDIFQCVLSQRFDCTPAVDAFEIYRSLRIVNPSPYLYFLRFNLEEAGSREQGVGNRKTTAAKKQSPGSSASLRTTATSPTPYSLLPTPSRATRAAHLVGSSPEMLVRVSTTNNTSRIEYRPIAGSRPRGVTEAQDRAFEADLRADAKEVSEHVMLVDLGRNDVGRVSEFGTVEVKDLMFVERYSHIMHLVSALEGRLRKGLAPIDAFRACFPAGTLSGAPKIRAMEVIEELEPARRGIYGGAIFYADFSGNLDSCIAIRTLFLDGDQGHIQAGAGIVADSIPEKEHEECQNKAKAVVRAIERARQS